MLFNKMGQEVKGKLGYEIYKSKILKLIPLQSLGKLCANSKTVSANSDLVKLSR